METLLCFDGPIRTHSRIAPQRTHVVTANTRPCFPPAGICAYRSTASDGEDGSSADHQRKWSAHHLAVPLQRSHLPARACRALQAAERPRQHTEGTMTSWPTAGVPHRLHVDTAARRNGRG